MSDFDSRIKLAIILFTSLIVVAIFFALFLNRTMLLPSAKTQEATAQPTEELTQNISLPPLENIQKVEEETIIIMGGNNPKYQITTPITWNTVQENDTEEEAYQLLLSKQEHEITISQLEGGQAICQYPPHAAVEKTSIQFDAYQEINSTASESLFRRGRPTDKQPVNGFINWTVCQYQKGEDEYISPTSFGFIVYRTPAGYDKNILEEMDKIISSIKPLTPLDQ